jgi:hypothetical protein
MTERNQNTFLDALHDHVVRLAKAEQVEGN